MNLPTTSTSRLVSLGLLAGALFTLTPTSSAASGGDDGTVQIQFLASTGLDANGKAKARLREEADETDFQVELEQMDPGSYDLYVGGALRGSISVGGAGEGELEFEAPQDDDKPLLDFDVIDRLIEIRREGEVFFSAVFGSGGTSGGGKAKPDKIEVFMVNVGSDANAKGRLRYEAKSGKTRFKVNLQNLDAGEHQLLVAGAPVAVFDPQGVHEVEVDFRDPPDDDPDQTDDDELELHLTLDFDPLGETVEVARDGETLLSGTLPASGKQAGVQPCSKGKQGAKNLGGKKADALRVILHSTGVLAGACGEVDIAQDGTRLDLAVTLRGVADGEYVISVEDVERATLNVTGGEGVASFSTDPSGGEALLDFPVKGASLAVSLAADPILQIVIPTSVQEALAQYVPEKHAASRVRMNLYNGGEDLDTRGSLLLRIKPQRQVLKLKAIDLPQGEYTLRADGLDVGTLTITKNGAGRAVFDTKAKPGSKKQPFEFEALGTTLELVDGDGRVHLRTVLD